MRFKTEKSGRELSRKKVTSTFEVQYFNEPTK
jgi:hypothetical protein